ncbi:MAG: DNA/RNA non-specific endonuclease [Sphingobacteriaceae bacterium]|nr:DNA/RNA non-specific endonuclease [Sphingobacteriaceae bacterium]
MKIYRKQLSHGLLCLLFLLLACAKAESPSTVNASAANHLLLGNPSQADALQPSNYLLEKSYYTSSYNTSTHIANWTAWHLEDNDLGNTPRQDDFRADISLPQGWYQVNQTSFSGSGFDRGHLCPSADRTSSVAANSSTFLMTNMLPQAPQNNQQTWGNFEDYLRSLVQNQGMEVYMIMGHYGTGGTGKNGYAESIDGGQILVPAFIYKIAVVLPQGTSDLDRIAANTRVISITTPNTQAVSSNWKDYRCSVDALEQFTGYNFLSMLPANLQASLESQVDAY